MPDGSISSPMKDDEKHLIRILLESFASNRLGAPNCKVSRRRRILDLARSVGFALGCGCACHVRFLFLWFPLVPSPPLFLFLVCCAGDLLARQALYLCLVPQRKIPVFLFSSFI